MMTTIQKTLAATLLLTLAAGCANESLPGSQPTDQARKITLTASMKPDGNQPQTRISHETDGQGNTPGIIVKWTTGDAFQLIYPIQGDPGSTYSSSFTIKNADDITLDGKTAKFEGRMAGTVQSAPANALYPAEAAVNADDNPTYKWADIILNMDGQMQTGNDNYDHTPAYDYMTATVDDATNLPANNDLDFHHLVSMMTMNITGAPAGIEGDPNKDSNIPEQLTLTTDGENGNFYNHIQLNGDNNGTPNTLSPGSITLGLRNIVWGSSGFIAHCMMLPTDLSRTTFTIFVRCKDGSRYSFTTPQQGKNFVAGKRYTATIEGSWTKVESTSAIEFTGEEPSAPFTQGDGTAQSPYLITTAGELKYLVEQVNKGDGSGGGNSFDGKYIRLAKDINVTASEWIPIGISFRAPLNAYFDGGGHTVSGKLKNSDEAIAYFGFIGTTQREVCNLHVSTEVESKCDGNGNEYIHIGGIIGYGGNVSGCSFNGSVKMTEGSKPSDCYIGGIAGIANNVSNCFVNATITAPITSNRCVTGGVTGSCINSSDCIMRGSIEIAETEGDEAKTGGIAGRAGGYVTRCQNYANINKATLPTGASGIDYITGGIAGISTAVSCTNEGNIDVGNTYGTGNNITGGLVGEANKDITNSLNKGNVIGGQGDTSSICGGLVGFSNYGVTYSNCTNQGTVTGNPGTVGTATAKRYTGGLVGENNKGLWHQCVNEAVATVTGASGNTDTATGGIAGFNNNTNFAHIYDCCTNNAAIKTSDGSVIIEDIGTGKTTKTTCNEQHR